MIHTTFFYSPIPLPYNGTDIKDTGVTPSPLRRFSSSSGALDPRLILFFFATFAVI